MSGIITLTFSNWVYEFPIWFPVLVIARDVVVVTGSLLLHYIYGRVEVHPSWVGKIATAFQMMSIAGVMLQIDQSITLFGREVALMDAVVAITGFFTLISGVGYVMDGIRQLQAADPIDP